MYANGSINTVELILKKFLINKISTTNGWPTKKFNSILNSSCLKQPKKPNIYRSVQFKFPAYINIY